MYKDLRRSWLKYFIAILDIIIYGCVGVRCAGIKFGIWNFKLLFDFWWIIFIGLFVIILADAIIGIVTDYDCENDVVKVAELVLAALMGVRWAGIKFGVWNFKLLFDFWWIIFIGLLIMSFVNMIIFTINYIKQAKIKQEIIDIRNKKKSWKKCSKSIRKQIDEARFSESEIEKRFMHLYSDADIIGMNKRQIKAARQRVIEMLKQKAEHSDRLNRRINQRVEKVTKKNVDGKVIETAEKAIPITEQKEELKAEYTGPEKDLERVLKVLKKINKRIIHIEVDMAEEKRRGKKADKELIEQFERELEEVNKEKIIYVKKKKELKRIIKAEAWNNTEK